MKKILLLSIFSLNVFIILAQSGFHYQGVARKKDGTAYSNQNVSLLISIISKAPENLHYKESHTVQTDQSGRFGLVVGAGTPIEGSFASINWTVAELFLKTEMDAGLGFESMGEVRILPVPLATYALKTAYDFSLLIQYPNAASYVSVAQGSSSNATNLVLQSYMYDHEPVEVEIKNSIAGLNISPANFTTTVDVSPYNYLTINAANVTPGMYTIPVTATAKSGKVRNSSLQVQIVTTDSLNKNYGGGYYVVDFKFDTLGRLVDSLYYNVHSIKEGTTKIRFTNTDNIDISKYPLANNTLISFSNINQSKYWFIESQGAGTAASPFIQSSPYQIESGSGLRLDYTSRVDGKVFRHRAYINAR